MVGNAVPFPLASALGRELFKSLLTVREDTGHARPLPYDWDALDDDDDGHRMQADEQEALQVFADGDRGWADTGSDSDDDMIIGEISGVVTSPMEVDDDSDDEVEVLSKAVKMEPR